MKRLLYLALLTLTGCTAIPNNIEPVTQFEMDRYLGQWYEVARLDHSFERGLTQVSATYQLREDGGVDVLNRGFDQQQQSWSEAKGKAYFVGEPDIGHLKVSFFGPSYSSYVIFELDDDYQYAFISGYNNDYLWLLARTATVSDQVKQRFIEQSDRLGFDSSALIWLD